MRLHPLQLTSYELRRYIELLFDRWNHGHVSANDTMSDLGSLLYWPYNKRRAKLIIKALEAFDAGRGR